MMQNWSVHNEIKYGKSVRKLSKKKSDKQNLKNNGYELKRWSMWKNGLTSIVKNMKQK